MYPNLEITKRPSYQFPYKRYNVDLAVNYRHYNQLKLFSVKVLNRHIIIYQKPTFNNK